MAPICGAKDWEFKGPGSPYGAESCKIVFLRGHFYPIHLTMLSCASFFVYRSTGTRTRLYSAEACRRTCTNLHKKICREKPSQVSYTGFLSVCQYGAADLLLSFSVYRTCRLFCVCYVSLQFFGLNATLIFSLIIIIIIIIK